MFIDRWMDKEIVVHIHNGVFSSVQFSHSVVSDSLWPHESQHAGPPCASPTPRVHSFMSIKSVMPSSHLILCCPLLLLPPVPPSIRVFSNESTLCMRWPKYWSFSFSIIPLFGCMYIWLLGFLVNLFSYHYAVFPLYPNSLLNFPWW